MESKHSHSAVVVAFARYEIEEHVAISLRHAWQFSDGHTLNASQLAKGQSQAGHICYRIEFWARADIALAF